MEEQNFSFLFSTELRSRLKNGEDVTLPDGRIVCINTLFQKIFHTVILKIPSKDVTLPGEPPVKVLSMFEN